LNNLLKRLVPLAIILSLGTHAAEFENQNQAATGHSKFEDIEQLRGQIKENLMDYFSTRAGSAKIEVTVSRIDKRLKLANCSQQKTIEVNGDQVKSANVSVRVSCEGEVPWSIFVPASVAVIQQVVTATRDIYRDEILSAEDLMLSERNTSDIGFGYADSLLPFIGNSVTRNISAGSVLRLAHVREPTVVNRGDKITLEAGQGGLSVVVSAVAMAEGKRGDQIPVKNTQTNRVIQAFILGPGRAAANL
jgi:flagella basal body P-ring formation protein FlgA